MTEKRLIDANALLSQINDPKGLIILDGRAALVSGEWEGLRRQKDVIAAVEASPIVDAVPVVRCRDCIHRDTEQCPMIRYTYDIAGDLVVTEDYTTDEGFCDLGEQEESEDD